MSFCLEKEAKSKTNISQLLAKNETEAKPSKYVGQPANVGDALQSTTPQYEEPTAAASIRRQQLTKDEEDICTTPLKFSRPPTSKDIGATTTPRFLEQTPTSDSEAKHEANIKSHLTIKTGYGSTKSNSWQPLTEKDTERKSTTKERPTLAVEKEEAKSKPMSYSRVQATSKHKDSKMATNFHGRNTLNFKQVSSNNREKVISKDEENKSTAKTKTAEAKRTKISGNGRETSTANNKKVKIPAVMKRDQETQNNVKVQPPPLTGKDKMTKTTALTGQPFALNDIGANYLSQINARLSSKNKKSEIKTDIRGRVTSTYKESTKHYCEAMISKEKDVKSALRIREPPTSKDEEVHIKDIISPLTVNGKEAKSISLIHGLLIPKDYKIINTTSDVSQKDQEAAIATHEKEPLAAKNKNDAISSHLREHLKSKAKHVAVSAHQRDPLRANDGKVQLSKRVRNPIKVNDKDGPKPEHIRESLTGTDEENKLSARVRKPLTAKDKTVAAISAHGGISSKEKDKDAAKSKHVRAPLNAKSKENKASDRVRVPSKTKYKEANISAHVRETLTMQDQDAKYVKHGREPVKAKDEKDKSSKHARQPLKANAKENESSAHVTVSYKANDKEHQILSAQGKEKMTVKKKENLSAHGNGPLATKEKKTKLSTQVKEQLTAKEIKDKLSAHDREPLKASDEEAIRSLRLKEALAVNEMEDYIKSENEKCTLENGKHKSQKDRLLGTEVNEKWSCPEKRTDVDSKSVRLHTGSITYKPDKCDFDQEQIVKKEDKSNKDYSLSTTLPHRHEDKKTVGTSKRISKTGSLDVHCTDSSESIPSLEKNCMRDRRDYDSKTKYARHINNSDEEGQDQLILSLGTLFSEDKDAENKPEYTRTEHKTIKTQDKVREQKGQYRRHEQDEKVHTGNEDMFKSEADLHIIKGGGVAEKQEVVDWLKKAIADIRNKSSVQNSIEINGCRPKQKTYVHKNVTRQAFERKHKDTTTFSTITGISFLKRMMNEDSEIVVSELTKVPSLLKDSIERAAKDETVMALFLQILEKAFSSKSSIELLIPLFETLKTTGFFDILVEYLARIIVQIKSGQTDSYTFRLVLKYILSITIEQITRNPSSFVSFRKVYALIGQIIDELDENGTADDEVIAEYQRLTEQKKMIEKEERKVSGQNIHSTPPDDFRQYPVSPSTEEITGKVKPFLRPNTICGGYEDLNDYLDVQFRLLREDFVGPLRDGITGYINMMVSNRKYQNTTESLRNLDIKVYENVRVHSPVVSQHGLCYKLKLQMNASLRRLNLKYSKRLIYGSMVCLTDNDFKNFFLATVVEREERDIKRGVFTVHFEREDVSTKDLLNNVFRMVETAGYFEAYRHVLSSLQTFNNGDLPFEKYIVSCEKEINRPAYLDPNHTYDLRPLVDQNVELKADKRLGVNGLTLLLDSGHEVEFSQRSTKARAVNVTNFKSWPNKDLLQMDDSQYSAVQAALTNEFAIIQGPPGTGKTYIGLQIVKALLHNKSAWSGTGRCNRPMLIVCYTNHALDQFLEGIVKYFKGDVVRVGGRSSSEDLEEYNLKKYRQMRFKRGTTLARLQYNKRQARRSMESQSRCVQRLAKTIQVYQTEILTEEKLSLEMGHTLYDSLINGYRGKKKCNFSYIVKWLGIEYLKRECQNEIQKTTKTKKTKHVRVEDETSRMQKERMIDIAENLHFSANEKSILQRIRNTDIAFFVDDSKTTRRQKGKEPNKGTMQDKHFLKVFKSRIVEKITDEDVMSQEEAYNIKDVWRMNHKMKWRLYRLWIRNMCANLYEEIEAKRRHFEAASEEYRNALEQVDMEIMRRAVVIGMTTSGAARYQSVLRDIGPRIIVVEEAAEVLEAHIITTLSKGCEHLILIGDHKQLRPNPTVYKLAIKYNLDVSLFERMVKNEMHFNCLELQHRMRPEISCIMKHIYPNLKDHEYVKTYPNVKGISTNLFLINHAHIESCNEDIKSYINTKEAEYAVALCRYLLLQGYERQDITVLTTYTGQLMYMRNLMPEEEFDGVNVTVVDNYQGEENKIVILSLVRSNTIDKIGFLKTENRICVALSRAKIGFFILGNFDHLANHSSLWKDITTDMKMKNYFGDGLALYCQNHPCDNAIVAKDAEDFKRAPEGGCIKKCEVRLECGHKCERHCHVLDKEHNTNKCQKPCTKTLCELGHKCPLKCFYECKPCSVLIQKLMPECRHFQLVPCAIDPMDFHCQEPCEKELQCGHRCKNKCGDDHTIRCLENINFAWPCGHTSKIFCWEARSKLCPHPCRTELLCKHVCSGTCGTCLMGRIHQPCRKTRTVQHFCGHQLSTVCQNHPTCDKPCEKRCGHGVCTKLCGELCDPCKRPCLLKCPHNICTRACNESCDRRWCNMPCQTILNCKHKCIGICGESCPNICRWCHKKIFKAKIFGNRHKQDARFILLEDCGHLVEYRVMDATMPELTAAGNVRLKCCPKCKTPIRKCLRYGNIIKLALGDIERAKKYLIGDISMYYTLKNRISRITTENGKDLMSDSEMKTVSQEETRTKYSCQYYRSMCKKALGERLAALNTKGLYTERQLMTIQKQYEIANEIIDLILNIVACEDSLKNPKKEISLPLLLHEDIQIVLQPRDIITQQENEDFRQEIRRGRAYVKLLRKKKTFESFLGTEDHTYTDVRKIESILLDQTRFTKVKEKEMNALFERLDDSLPVTEEEIDIVV